MNRPEKIFLLIGANTQMARRFCHDREMSIAEIGHSVITTRMGEERLRGLSVPIEFVYGMDDDPRPFADGYTRQDQEAMREADRINFFVAQRIAGTDR